MYGETLRDRIICYNRCCSPVERDGMGLRRCIGVIDQVGGIDTAAIAQVPMPLGDDTILTVRQVGEGYRVADTNTIRVC